MKRAFTLLEMVVVMMVIAVLCLLTIPNVSKVIDAVDSKACNALTKVVDAAAVQFKMIYGQYPASVNDLVNAGLLDSEQSTCSNGKSIYFADGHAVYD